MLAQTLISFVVFVIAAFVVQRTSRQAANPRKWTRNGLLGIATISTAVMATLIKLKNPAAFSLLGAWLPGMMVGILAERWEYGRRRPD